MLVFAGLAAVAAMMMWIPKAGEHEVGDPNACRFHIPLAVSITLAIGFLGGRVGQGGLLPLHLLLIHILRLPTRVVIGSNLAIVFLASLAGFGGKAATGAGPLFTAGLPLRAGVPGAPVRGARPSRPSTPLSLPTGRSSNPLELRP